MPNTRRAARVRRRGGNPPQSSTDPCGNCNDLELGEQPYFSYFCKHTITCLMRSCRTHSIAPRSFGPNTRTKRVPGTPASTPSSQIRACRGPRLRRVFQQPAKRLEGDGAPIHLRFPDFNLMIGAHLGCLPQRRASRPFTLTSLGDVSKVTADLVYLLITRCAQRFAKRRT